MPDAKRTDYLGRRMVCDERNVERLLGMVNAAFKGQPPADIMAVFETKIADLVLSVARSRKDAHEGVDQCADDIKKYLNALFAERDQRPDQVGHA